MTAPSIEMDGKLLDVRGLKKYFPITKGVLGRQVGTVKAVDGVSFFVREGETWGLSARAAAARRRLPV